jgi:hypothetical protein
LHDFFYEREVVLEEKKDYIVVSVQADRNDPKKLSPQKPKVFEPSVQTIVLKELGKFVGDECNAKK